MEQTDIKISEDAHQEPDSKSLSYEAQTPAAATEKQLLQYKAAFSATTFGIGPAFGGFATYVGFQIQNIGYVVGRQPGSPAGSMCFDFGQPCLVPMAGSGEVNLTSYILYLNAITYALGGVLVFFVCGLGDYAAWKREQYIFLLFIYGALCLPAAGLRSSDLMTFNAYSGLYVTFNTIGFITQAWMNIFIPYTMRKAAPIEADQTDTLPASEPEEIDLDQVRTKREREGVSISVWGGNAQNASTIVFYCITIGLLNVSSAYAGLYMTTGAGAFLILISLVALPFLPRVGGLPLPDGWNAKFIFSVPWKTFLSLWNGVREYPEAFKLLISYTVYNDTVFAFGTVTSTLFQNVLRPSMLEFTLYSLSGAVTSLIFATFWLFLFPRTGLSLRQWAIGAYLLVSILPFWSMLGLRGSIPIGFKHRWEFYLFNVLQNAAGSVLSPLFRVFFCQLFPKGSEIRYFGFQLVLSCLTTWIPQVVNGPIIDATGQPRVIGIASFPLFLLCAFFAWWTDDKKGIERIQAEELEEANKKATSNEI